MAELKTQKNSGSVRKFLESLKDEQKRKDVSAIIRLVQQITKEKPAMWGSSIIGFGNYHYKYKSGREGDWFPIGVAPRKQNISIYLMTEFDKMKDLFSKLGSHKTGVCCLYIKKLEDIDMAVLKQLILTTYETQRRKTKDT